MLYVVYCLILLKYSITYKMSNSQMFLIFQTRIKELSNVLYCRHTECLYVSEFKKLH